MNTIELLGEEETFKNIVEREITEFEDNKIDVIRYYAFYNYSPLTNVSFPVATSIGIGAFLSCSGLTKISFPNATSIGNHAFHYCSNLRTIYVGTNTSTVCTLSNTNAFKDCTNLTNIYVPAKLVDSYKKATNWSSYADKIKAYE